jgi:hypothetical protein
MYDKLMQIEMSKKRILILMLLLLFPLNAYGMRCSGGIISCGDSQWAVLEKCGEPESSAQMGTKTYRVLKRGYEREVTVILEEWRYKLGYGTFERILHFEGGILQSIELGCRIE